MDSVLLFALMYGLFDALNGGGAYILVITAGVEALLVVLVMAFHIGKEPRR